MHIIGIWTAPPGDSTAYDPYLTGACYLNTPRVDLELLANILSHSLSLPLFPFLPLAPSLSLPPHSVRVDLQLL